MSLEGRKSLEPWMPDTIEYYPYQIDGIRRMVGMQNFLLADEMGLGKSLQSLTVAAADVIRGWVERIIIVAPVSLKGNWAEEITTFTRFPFLILGQEEIEGQPGKFKKLGPAARSKQLLQFDDITGPKILIVNYEQVGAHLGELNDRNFDVAIFDEAHYMKNHKAKRTKNCLKLKSRRSFLLTGTPLLNHVNELWPLLHRISPVEYPRYWPFAQYYCVWGGYKDKQIVGVKHEAELNRRLQSVMVRRLKKDVLDLPEIQRVSRKVDLTPEQRRIYDHAVENLEVEMSDLDDPAELENALVKFLRLKEICGTSWKFNGEDHSSKLDLAIPDALELLDNQHKIVVFTQFRPMLERYCVRLDQAAPNCNIWEIHGDIPPPERVPIVKAWAADPNPAVIVCSLKAGGFGLNMTAARHMQFLDKLFVPGLNKQAIDRCHRIGADLSQPVTVLDYFARNTVESRVEQILKAKEKVFANIVEVADFQRKLMKMLVDDMKEGSQTA